MATSPRSTPPGASRGADHKTAREKWEEAASHRDPEPRAKPRGSAAAGESPEPMRTGSGDLPASVRDTFLNTRDGAFYPSGHVVLGMAPDDASALSDTLEESGFAREHMLVLSPDEAAEVMRESDEQAGMLARVVGAEIRNARVMRQLAEAGTAFLIVRVDDDEGEHAVVEKARRFGVHKALRYHTLAIEELKVGAEEIPGDSPFGVNEVLRSKPSDARLKPRK